ncbi:MAG: PEP/pyruvate-binding domain-containing protein [Gaiellales bacterium]
MGADARNVLWYADVDEHAIALVGGKFGSLAEMANADFAVPDAFAVTTHAYSTFLAESGLRDRAEATLELDPDDLAAVQAASRGMMDAITSAPLPAPVDEAIRSAYARLADDAGQSDPPVAVRSSGVAEDLAGASFAGQYETYLWVVGIDSLLDHVRRCWAGLFGEAVLTYHPEALGEDREREAMGMGVVVQRMIDARSAGVAFTVDPVTGDRSKIVIESAWGLGEAVVSGEVTPDRFRVDKVTFEVIERSIADKHVRFAFEPGVGARLMDVDEGDRNATSLEDAEVTELAELAKRIERHRGAPQDMEWAIDQQGRVALLQVRPETIWSQRAAEAPSVATTDAMSLVLGQFMGGAGKPPTGGAA